MRPPPRKNAPKRKEKTRESDDEDAFQTPERADETDYGLEFTTSRLAVLNTSPRRTSTVRKSTPRGRRGDRISISEDSDDVENQSPQRSNTNRSSIRQPAISPQRPRITRSASSQPAIPAQRPKTNPQPGNRNAKPVNQRQEAPAASRRKQKKPVNHVQIMHREIERLQKSISFMIPRLPFSRLVREIMMEHTLTPFCITTSALEAIQTATEMYLTQRFQDAYLLTQYRSRVTLEVRDMAMVAYFCKTYGNL